VGFNRPTLKRQVIPEQYMYDNKHSIGKIITDRLVRDHAVAVGDKAEEYKDKFGKIPHGFFAYARTELIDNAEITAWLINTRLPSGDFADIGLIYVDFDGDVVCCVVDGYRDSKQILYDITQGRQWTVKRCVWNSKKEAEQ